MKLAEQQQNQRQAEAGKVDTQLALVDVVSALMLQASRASKMYTKKELW